MSVSRGRRVSRYMISYCYTGESAGGHVRGERKVGRKTFIAAYSVRNTRRWTGICNLLILVVSLLEDQLVVCGHVADRSDLVLLQIDGQKDRG